MPSLHTIAQRWRHSFPVNSNYSSANRANSETFIAFASWKSWNSQWSATSSSALMKWFNHPMLNPNPEGDWELWPSVRNSQIGCWMSSKWLIPNSLCVIVKWLTKLKRLANKNSTCFLPKVAQKMLQIKWTLILITPCVLQCHHTFMAYELAWLGPFGWLNELKPDMRWGLLYSAWPFAVW